MSEVRRGEVGLPQEFPMTTLLVDGPNLLARADFAAKGKHVEMSVGEVNTSALVIFVNMLSKYVRQVQPTQMAVFWDAGHAFRDAIYPEYKAARRTHVEPDENDRGPFTLAKEFLTWAGIPHKAHQGYEADDLIAAHARQTNQEVVILSGDKDLLQLVHDEDTGNPAALEPPTYGACTQIRVPDDDPWTERRVVEKFGVPPERLAQYLALVGDPGDGVPGVKGIGPKKALALLEQQDDWQSVLTALGWEKAQQAKTMRSLVDLRDYPYDPIFLMANQHAPEFRPTGPDSLHALWSELLNFCDTYRLNSIKERLEAGTLWHGQDDKPPSTEGLFDDLDNLTGSA